MENYVPTITNLWVMPLIVDSKENMVTHGHVSRTGVQSTDTQTHTAEEDVYIHYQTWLTYFDVNMDASV